MVADNQGQTIRRVTPLGVVTTVARNTGNPAILPNFSAPLGVAIDHAGNLFVSDAGYEVIYKITPGGVATILAGFRGVSGNVDGSGSAAGKYDAAADHNTNAGAADNTTPIELINRRIGKARLCAGPFCFREDFGPTT